MSYREPATGFQEPPSPPPPKPPWYTDYRKRAAALIGIPCLIGFCCGLTVNPALTCGVTVGGACVISIWWGIGTLINGMSKSW